MICIVSLKKLR